jgi:hypothetical protein
MCGTSAPSRPPVVAVIANDERSLVCLVYGGSIYGPKPVEETTSGGTHFDLANLDCEIVPTSKMPVARIGDLQIAMESLVGFR